MKIFDGVRNLLDMVVERIRSASADRDPDSYTNKPIFNHLYLKRFAIGIGVAFVGFLGFMIFSHGKEVIFGNMDKMNTKLRNDEGLVDVSMTRTSVFNKDPSTELDKKLGGKLGGLDTTAGQGSFDTGLGDSRNSNASDRLPTAAECSSLTDKVKAGEVLIGADKSQMGECLENNVLNLSDDEKRMLQALNDENLSPEERQRLLTGLTDKDAEKKNMAKAVASTITDPAQQMYRNALRNALEASDQSGATAIAKKVLGLPLTEEEQARVAKIAGNSSNAVSSLRDALSGKNPGADRSNLMKNAVEQAKKDAEDAAKKQQAANSATEDAKDAFKKAGAGLPLTPTDNEAISRAAQARVAADAANAKNAENREVLKQAALELQSSISEINSITDEELYSGYTIYDEEGKPVSGTKKGPKKVIAKKNTGLIIERKPMMEIDRIREGLGGGLNAKFKRRAAIDDKEVAQFSANASVLSAGKDGIIKLSKDIKVFATLETSIVYSQGGTTQRTVFKIQDDVYDPRTNDLLIPAGSFCYGKTTAFDEESGVMPQRCTEVTIGGGKTLELAFSAGGIDGSEGLTGQVFDNKARHYAGTIITSFASGVIGFMAQTSIAEYMNSRQMEDIVLGSAMGGASEVLKEIAENTSKDMQNSPRILRIPKGLPVILYGDN